MAAFRLCLLLVWATITVASGQSRTLPGKPSDTLDKRFHQQRRELLRKQLPPRSVAVFFASPIRNRANDVDYYYHQDPDFYYLTGYKEPNSVLLIFSEPQSIAGKFTEELLFVQPNDPLQEMWNGKRLGVEGAVSKLGIPAQVNTEFASFKLDTANLHYIFIKDLAQDIRDDESDDGDLFSLIQQFKKKAGYPSDYNKNRQMLYSILREHGLSQPGKIKDYLNQVVQQNPVLRQDKHLNAYVAASDNSARQQAIAIIPVSSIDGITLDQIMDEMREEKTEEELQLLRKAINISAIGQIEVMKAMHPGMSEMELQGIHEFVFKKYGAQHVGYPSIVGAGNNACVLHYIESSKSTVGNDLVLMDVGAEYQGYTADVTRTIPANGKFTSEQKAIYELVYKAQETAFKQCKVGNSFQAPGQAAQEVIADGLLKMGIIKNKAEARRYFPHGTSHYLGLDVHDRGTYGSFKPNTVITVEPGVYIPEGSPCDKKWWGIGVRIEDDILITKNGWENLSKLAPRTVEEIEKTMAQPSILDNFKLQELK